MFQYFFKFVFVKSHSSIRIDKYIERRKSILKVITNILLIYEYFRSTLNFNRFRGADNHKRRAILTVKKRH